MRVILPSIVALSFLTAACGGSSDSPGKKNPNNNTGGSGSGGTTGAGGSTAGGSTGTGGNTTAGGTSAGGTSAGGSAAGGTSAGGSGTAIFDCEGEPSAAPASTWVNATGNLANMASECGNLGLVSAQPCSNRVIAGIAAKGLWETVDGGVTWTQLGTGNGSATITNRISVIVYDPLDPNIFWEAGIYNGGGVYKTTDSGQTFAQLGSITHRDSLSVDLSDAARNTMLAGGHETNSDMQRSTDGGATWANVANGLPGGQCTSSLVIDSMTHLVGCNSGTIVRTTDGGGSWNAASGATLGGVFQPLLASDGTIYWPGGGGGIGKSTDDGATFTTSADPGTAPGIVAPAQLAELPDGRIAIIGTDHILLSADHGATWTPVGDAMPFGGGGYDGARGVAYSVMTKTFFVWKWDCNATVPADGIASMGFDWETQ